MSDTGPQQGTTPRPWRLVGPFYKGIPGKRNTAAPWIAGARPEPFEKSSAVCKALFIKPGDAALIVAAVNACDGMVDPAAEIAELRKAVRALAVGYKMAQRPAFDSRDWDDAWKAIDANAVAATAVREAAKTKL